MTEQLMREELIRAHLNMREHLYRIIDGLTQELLLKEVSDESQYPHMLSLIWHIGGAETYWFHRANHDIAPKLTIESCEDIQKKLKENTEGIKRVLRECESNQIQIVGPEEEGGPSVAWCLLRTYQHGLYHTAQISKMRHMIEGCPPLAGNEESWNNAVNSVVEIVRKLYESR